MDYSLLINQISEIVAVCFPISLIFGVTAKLCDLAYSFIFNKKVDF